MTRDQVASEKSKVKLDTPSAPDEAPGWEEMPEAFLSLINRSLSLQGLVRRMDDEIYGERGAAVEGTRDCVNPVSDQISLLNTAFARG